MTTQELLDALAPFARVALAANDMGALPDEYLIGKAPQPYRRGAAEQRQTTVTLGDCRRAQEIWERVCRREVINE